MIMALDTSVLFNILIIAGVRNILSLHFTILIHFDEYYVCVCVYIYIYNFFFFFCEWDELIHI